MTFPGLINVLRILCLVSILRYVVEGARREETFVGEQEVSVITAGLDQNLGRGCGISESWTVAGSGAGPAFL